MPGYMMHLCEGKCILDEMKQSGRIFSDDEANDFLLGCVLPDAVDDKELTHFRPAWQQGLITKYPDLNRLTLLYPTDRMTAADLGILAHLMMDSHYVTDFWPSFFRFEDEDGLPTAITDDIDHVKLSDGRLIPPGVFFSHEYFYGDYDATNGLFLRDFKPSIPDVRRVSLTIAECRAFSPSRLICDLKQFALAASSPAPYKACTHVFSYEAMRDFVKDEAERFLSEI